MSTGNYAQVNGINMYYEIHGEGKPLVLIHGGGSTITTSFGVLLPMLAQHYKIIAVELQAHGHTSDRDAPESFAQDADDVAELLHQLSISRAHILGFSNGGSTTMQIAIRHPEIADKVIVIAGAFKREGFISGFFDGMQYATLGNMPQGLKDAFLRINPDENALFNMFSKDKQRMIDFKDWNDGDLQAIRSPALIINGDKDVMTNEHALKISTLIPDSRLVILPGTHGQYIGEKGTVEPDSILPQVTTMLINDFLDN
jgi:pimeloyl-ACP methyl ester carboxylesterase